MAQTSYVSPVYDVGIRGPKGQYVDLKAWRRKPDNPNLESLEIKLKNGGSNEITLNLKFEYTEFVGMVKRNLSVFSPESVVEVRVGYASKPPEISRSFMGIIQYPSSVSFEDNIVSMTIEAKGSGHLASRRDAALTFDGETVLEALRQLFDSNGMELYRLTSKGEQEKVSGTDVRGLQKPLFRTFRRNDMLVIDELIRQELGHDYYISGDRVVLCDLLEIGREKRTPMFQYRGNVDFSEDVFPMENFDGGDVKYPWIASAYGVKSRDIDPQTGEVTEVEGEYRDRIANARKYGRSPAEEQLMTTLQDEGIFQFGSPAQDMMVEGPFRKDNTGVHQGIPAQDPSQKEKADKERKRGEQLGGIEGSWDTMGIPWLEPNMISRVRGVTPLYNGPYYHKVVTHSGGMDGYDSSVEAYTTALSNEVDQLNKLIAEREGQEVPDDGETTDKSSNKESAKPTPSANIG